MKTSSMIQHSLFFLLLAQGCGQNSLWPSLEVKQQRQARWQELIAQGRRMDMQRGQEASDSLSLLGQDVVSAQWHDEPHYATRLTYDTRLTPGTPAAGVATLAHRWIDDHHEILGVTVSDLRPLTGRVIWIDDNWVSVSYQRVLNEVLVKDAFVEVILGRGKDGNYHIAEVTNNSFGPLTVTEDWQSPTAESVASLIGSEDYVMVNAEPMIIPQQRGDETVWVMGSAVDVESAEDSQLFTLYTDNAAKEIAQAFSHRVYGNTAFKARVYKRSYILNETMDLPLTLVNVSNGTTTTKLNRDGQADVGGASAVTLTLDGDRGTIYDNTSSSPFQISQAVSGDNVVVVGDDNAKRALNAYVSIQRINSFTRRHLTPAESGSYLGTDVKIKINVTGNCNAFYDPSVKTISLYAAGNNCGNMAVVNDVVYHEWGHGLDAHTGKTAGIQDGAYSEGLSDVVSAYYTGSADLAPGFQTNSTTGLRNLDNNKKYPADKGEVHDEGQIIGGAFWHMRESMVKRYGETKGAFMSEMYFFKSVLTTDSYTESYDAVLRLDDDDNNAATPSPNRCLIDEAFSRHGLGKNLNCQDTVKEPTYPINDNINIGIKSRSGNSATLMASSMTGVELTGCLGTSIDCQKSLKADIAFDIEGQKNGRIFFVTKSAVDLTGGMMITLIVRDANKVVIGTRTVRIAER